MKIKFLPIILAGAVTMSAAGIATISQAQDVSVMYDGRAIETDLSARIVSGRTMIPMRAIFEALGAKVKWDADTKTVSARKGNKTVALTIGSSTVTLDKGKLNEDLTPKLEYITLDAAPYIEDGRTFVPLRAVSEAFGYDVEWDADAMTVSIKAKENDAGWKENTGSIDLGAKTVSGEGVSFSDGNFTITKGGDFTVTGEAVCSITVDTKDRVKLRLSGAHITSTSGPAIYIKSADKAYITVSDGTENTLSVGGSANALHSKDELEIKGKGSLGIKSEVGHGIKVSDDLSIDNAVISIVSGGDGINVNDTLSFIGGSLTISASGDGISSDSIVDIRGGSIDITTTGNAKDDNVSSKGIKADWLMSIGGGKMKINSTDHCIHCGDDVEISGGSLELSSEMKKGISSHGNVTVSGEDTFINVIRSTEGIEGKKVLTVNNGTIYIKASDDGVNAGTGREGGFGGMGGFGGRMRPEGQFPRGERPQPPQYGTEQPDIPFGEAKRPQMPPQNSAERPDIPFGEAERPQMPPQGEPQATQPVSSQGSASIVINGGHIVVSAGGDCLDANGTMDINGGELFLIRTRQGNNMEGVFDTIGAMNIGSGTTIIAAANATELQSVSSNEQNAIFAYLEKSYPAGSEIVLYDKSGKKLFGYAPDSVFMSVYITSPLLTEGDAYTLSVGGDTHELTVSGKSTTVGTPATGFGGMGGRNKRW